MMLIPNTYSDRIYRDYDLNQKCEELEDIFDHDDIVDILKRMWKVKEISNEAEQKILDAYSFVCEEVAEKLIEEESENHH